MLYLLLKGLIIGFSIAAPVGPIGILCINRSLYAGFKIGLATGLGAATADLVFGCIAAFGLTFISNFLLSQQFWIRLIGGLFLLYLGARILITKPKPQSSQTTMNLPQIYSMKLLHAYTTTFFLTLTNPMTILSFIAVFAGLGMGSTNATYWEASLLVSGVVLGSLFWWLLLSGIVAGLLRSRLKHTTLMWVNRLSGVLILIFGAGALISLWRI